MSITIGNINKITIGNKFAGKRNTDSQYCIFTSENGIIWRKGIRDGYIVLDIALTATGFLGSENTDWKNIDSTPIIQLPDEDALFDSRNGIQLLDSKNNEVITISRFPAISPNARDGIPYYFYQQDISSLDNVTDFTFFILCYANQDRGISCIEQMINTSTLYADNIRHHIVQSNPVANIISSEYYIPGWNLIGWEGVAADSKIYPLYNSRQADSRPYVGTFDPRLEIEGNGIGNLFACALYNRVLTQQEKNYIRTNGVWPSDGIVYQILFNQPGDTIYFEHIESINGFRGYNGTGIGFQDNGSSMGRPGYWAWTYPLTDMIAAYDLLHGFTRRGNFTIPYKPDSTKGSFSDIDDIEHPSNGVLHNMCNSLLDFSAISDVTIKAIFDKSNRIYWKASIENELDYTDAGGGYYGLWRPEQLIKSFIDVHAQVGHENHIFTGLRTSTFSVTGITSIRVYKTNISD